MARFLLPAAGQRLTLTLPPGTRRVERVTLGLKGESFEDSLLGAPARAAGWAPTISQAGSTYTVDLHRMLLIVGSTYGGQPIGFKPWLGVQFASEDAAGEALTQKLLVAKTGVTLDSFANSFHARTRSLPSSVRVMVEGRPPFFYHTGDMKGEAAVPDFAAEVNRWLAEAEPTAEGTYQVPLLLLSDTPGFLTVLPGDLAYEVAVPATLDGATRFDADVAAGERLASTLSFSLPQALPGAALAAVSLQVSSELDADLIAAAQPLSDGRVAVLINRSITAAQPVTPLHDGESTGARLWLAGMPESGALQVELRADQDGAPGPEALATGIAEVNAGAAGAWVELLWNRRVALRAGRAVWLVLRAVRGMVLWEGKVADQPALQYTRDGGRTWQSHSSPAASGRFQLMYRPGRAAAVPALSLQLAGTVGEQEPVAVPASARPQAVELKVAGAGPGGDAITLLVEAAAAGRVGLSDAQVALRVETSAQVVQA